MAQFLIRTNIDECGWTSDGIFGPKEAIEQISAFEEAAKFARVESDVLSEIAVFALVDGYVSPLRMTQRDREDGRHWFAGDHAHIVTRIP